MSVAVIGFDLSWQYSYNTKCGITERLSALVFVSPWQYKLMDVWGRHPLWLFSEVTIKSEIMSDICVIRPLADRVVVRPLTNEEAGNVSSSGIIIPDSAKKDKPEQGVVIAVGEGKWNDTKGARIALDVKVGDRIVFSKYGYDEVKIDSKELFIVAESSILGVFVDAK